MEKYLIGSHIEAYPYERTKLNIYNKNTGKTFVLGEKESAVFRLMNGVNTLEDIQRKCPWYTVDEIRKLAAAFTEIGMFDKKKAKINPLKIKLSLFNPNKLLKENGTATFIFHYIICLGAPVWFLFSLAVRLLNPSSSAYAESIQQAFSDIGFSDIIILVIMALVCLALHDFGHMITARRYGVNVPEIGVMLYFFIPCAYTNVTGINLLKSKGKRLVVLLSGTLVNLGIIGTCFLIMSLSPSVKAGLYCTVMILVNLGSIFMNTMVLIKFDGYYVMEILLDEVKLREKAINHIITYMTVMLGKNTEAKKAVSDTLSQGSNLLEHIAYCVYAVLSVSYIPFIMLNTVIPFIF